MQYLDNLRQYILLKAEVAAGEPKEEELLRAHEALFDNKPVRFDPFDPDNAPKHSEEQLAEMIATMEDNGTTDAGNMTEWAFYHRCRYLKKKFAATEGR